MDTAALWAAVDEFAPRAAAMSAAALVVSLVPEDEDSAEVAMRAALTNWYATVRPFLALLGETSVLGAAPVGARVLAGVRRLPAAGTAAGEGQAAAAAPGGRQARAAGLEVGGPGRVRGVRAGAAAPGPSAAGRLRLALAPVVRPAGPSAGRQGVGRRL
ncbi:hypothetical protein ABZ322_34165 [Streptomyces sp. NPDC006129]|uniref:hypothetical protein n=1 Tax=Streptomyces sp. NPDC006129 TaxID=3155348 RepID=UPI0033B23FF1